jgi:Tat protein translocase TatB subunit
MISGRWNVLVKLPAAGILDGRRIFLKPKVFMSFIGTQELLMILVVAIVVVGPKRLPELAKGLGQGIRNLRQASAKVRAELNASGALDEINQLKNSVRGVVNDLQTEVTELTARQDMPAQDNQENQPPLLLEPPPASPLPDAENEVFDPPPAAASEKK